MASRMLLFLLWFFPLPCLFCLGVRDQILLVFHFLRKADIDDTPSLEQGWGSSSAPTRHMVTNPVAVTITCTCLVPLPCWMLTGWL